VAGLGSSAKRRSGGRNIVSRYLREVNCGERTPAAGAGARQIDYHVGGGAGAGQRAGRAELTIESAARSAG
jgi:hypothetical protein